MTDRQIKICGLKTKAAIDLSIKKGADMIGLVFFPPSPRNVSIKQGAMLGDHARGHIKIVALVVDASDELLMKINTSVKPDMYQAHGSETPERIGEMKKLTGVPIIKAIKVKEQKDVESADDYQNVADIILFDAKAPDDIKNPLPGGNGVRFDWSLLKSAKPPASYMLSGGLDPANVKDAIVATNAAIIDVSSGVESAPGKKDHTAIKNFIEAARAAS